MVLRSGHWFGHPAPPLRCSSLGELGLCPLDTAKLAQSSQGVCPWTQSQGVTERGPECRPLDSTLDALCSCSQQRAAQLLEHRGGRCSLARGDAGARCPVRGSSLTCLELSSILGLHACAFLSCLALKSKHRILLLSLALDGGSSFWLASSGFS